MPGRIGRRLRLDEALERVVESLHAQVHALSAPLDAAGHVARHFRLEVRIAAHDVAEAGTDVQELHVELLEVGRAEALARGCAQRDGARGAVHQRDARRHVGAPRIAPAAAHAGHDGDVAERDRRLRERLDGAALVLARREARRLEMLEARLGARIDDDRAEIEAVEQLGLVQALRFLLAAALDGLVRGRAARQVVESGDEQRRREALCAGASRSRPCGRTTAGCRRTGRAGRCASAGARRCRNRKPRARARASVTSAAWRGRPSGARACPPCPADRARARPSGARDRRA